ncbi:AMP-binding protein [Mesorhizobium sp. B2-9-1]|uniref:non-ribosomal peptide synthetase n=1 Tax=Mesorhizobium sp. B2-9-1 TaxID=2589898 RepID=UPI0015E47E82|nr:AMP-binding protein [Mesorhizobium sp. B2-9-1]
MSPAYSGSELAIEYPRTDSQSAAYSKWTNVPEYALDQGGPVLRPYQRMDADYADVAIVDHLKNVATQYPEKLAITDATNRFTYSELVSAVEALASRILAITPAGNAVGILLANTAFFPLAMLASMAAGRPLVPLNTRDPDTRINAIVSEARLSTVIGDGDVRPTGLPRAVGWINVSPRGEPKSDRVPQLHPVSVDAPAIVLYTSGSTGRPKGIVNSQRSLLWRVQQYVNACHINEQDVFLPLTGPATIAGCREVLAALLTGATLHLLEVEAVGLRAVLHRMQAEGVTVTYLVPALLRALMANKSEDAFRSLRVARIGGEKVSRSDIKLLRDAVSSNCLVQIGYSSTETTGSQWFVPTDWPEQAASVPVGWLLPGISFAIIDEQGRPVPPGGTGELVIKSPYVLLGHWENGVVVPVAADPENPSVRIFETGDLVQLDNHGLLQIMGRKGRQIKINGRRVEPAELERVLRGAPSVEDAVAIVTASTELIAFAVPRGPATSNFADDLRHLARTTLPPPLCPLRLHAIAEIPRLPGGKVDMARLAELDGASVRQDRIVQAPNTGPERTIQQIVQRAWTKILNTRVASGRWDDAGGDSLKLLHCVMEIESVLGLEIDLEPFTVGMNFDEMVKAVAAAKAGNEQASSRKEHPPILFLLPGSVGYGPSLAAFAASMGRTARVVPIRYPALAMILQGKNSVADMAEAALDQIRRAQPEGNVRLLGHSLGGVVAFEVASRLLAVGRNVKFLGILDTSLLGERSTYRETVVRTIHRIRTNRITAYRMACRALAKVVVRMGYEMQLARLLDRYAQEKFNATSFRAKLELQEVLRAKAFFQWLQTPRPQLPITGTLFRCARPGMPRAIGWDNAFADLDVIPIIGTHIDMVSEPNVASNRPLIEAAVARTYLPEESRQGEERSST